MKKHVGWVVLAAGVVGVVLWGWPKKQLSNHAVVSLPVPVKSVPKKTALESLKDLLHREAKTLNEAVIDKVLTTWSCADQYQIEHTPILTIIDYSMPANEKRLWVFDLLEKKLLFHTYVAHGINSGALLTQYFSNKNNSKASSIGVYSTDKAYAGREGLALRLSGLDRRFNDNASNRAVVMHGGWYVDADFIKKYGRPGRSWGCPAVPLKWVSPIINTIKNKSLMVMYYPNEDWFTKSKFLNCQALLSPANKTSSPVKDMVRDTESRENVLLVDNHASTENALIMVMTADAYMQRFHQPAPLSRMLRRQIDNMEYIALSDRELEQMIQQPQEGSIGWGALSFARPEVKMRRGYYETEMHKINLGTLDHATREGQRYKLSFTSRPCLFLKTTNGFIRWLGL